MGVTAWTGFIWLGMGPWEHGKELSVSIKAGN